MCNRLTLASVLHILQFGSLFPSIKSIEEVEDKLAHAVTDCLCLLENAHAVTHSDLSVQWHHLKLGGVDRNQNSVDFEPVSNTDT